MQVAELLTYVCLLADWSVLRESAAARHSVLLLGAVVLLPVIYTRRVIQYSTASC